MKIFVNEPIHPAAMELLRSRAEVVSEWEDVPAVSAALVRTTKIGPDFFKSSEAAARDRKARDRVRQY